MLTLLQHIILIILILLAFLGAGVMFYSNITWTDIFTALRKRWKSYKEQKTKCPQ